MYVEPSLAPLYPRQRDRTWLVTDSLSALNDKHRSKPKTAPKTSGGALTFRQKVLVVTMYILSLYVTASQLASSALEGSSRASLRALTLVSHAVLGSVSVHLITIAFHPINKRLKEDGTVLCAPSLTSSWTGTGELKPRTEKSEEKKYKRIVTKLLLFTYFISLLCTVIGDQVIGGEPRTGFSGRLWWNSTAEYTPEIVLRIGQVLDAASGNVLLFVPCIAIHWYIGICSWSHQRVVFLRERIHNLLTTEDQISASQLRSLQNLYQQLWGVISFIDNKLGKAVLIWHADLIANIILGARVIQKAEHWVQALESVAHFAYAVVFFFIISIVAANVVVESRNIEYDLCRLVCHIGAGDWHASNQIMLLQEEIQHCPLAFTGWNCFTLDRSYILTVAGAVVTYAVVLQQLT